MTNNSAQIAFFDIDKTILDINSGEALIRQCYQKGLISTIGLIRAVYTGIQYKYQLRDTHKIIHKMGSWLTGLSEEKFLKISNEIFRKDLLPNIRPNIEKEIKHLKEMGTEIVILSSSVTTVCKPLGQYLNVDDVLCTELEVKDGMYTGKPVGDFCFRYEKLIRLKEFCQKHNYGLNQASYYADSIDDLPTLEVVGKPVCVTPDRKLTKIAERRGWLIENW